MSKKIHILVAILSMAWTLTAGAGSFGVIPFVSYYETGDLPPTLMAIFDLDCSQRIERVLREERYDPATQTMVISIGALVFGKPIGDCHGITTRVEADAGKTFSGLRYEIQQLPSR